MSLTCATSSRAATRGRDVLAVAGRGRDEHVVMPHQLDDQRRDILGQVVGIGGVVRDMDLAHAGDLRAACAAPSTPWPTTADGLAQLRGGGDGDSVASFTSAVMFDPDERLHAATPMSLSLATSVSTSGTLTPAVRVGGSVTFSVFSRAVMSTP
jgi:hypothetical protein